MKTAKPKKIIVILTAAIVVLAVAITGIKMQWFGKTNQQVAEVQTDIESYEPEYDLPEDYTDGVIENLFVPDVSSVIDVDEENNIFIYEDENGEIGAFDASELIEHTDFDKYKDMDPKEIHDQGLKDLDAWKAAIDKEFEEAQEKQEKQDPQPSNNQQASTPPVNDPVTVEPPVENNNQGSHSDDPGWDELDELLWNDEPIEMLDVSGGTVDDGWKEGIRFH